MKIFTNLFKNRLLVWYLSVGAVLTLTVVYNDNSSWITSDKPYFARYDLLFVIGAAWLFLPFIERIELNGAKVTFTMRQFFDNNSLSEQDQEQIAQALERLHEQIEGKSD